MKTKVSQIFNALILVTAFSAQVIIVQAQGTTFTYQGQLYDGTNLANGNYDLRFHIYNALTGGSIVAGPITNAPVAVSNGLFVVTLDFGTNVFTGSEEWLQIGARSNGVAVAYTTLSPRQELTPTPYAIFAEGVNAGGLTGTIPAGDLSGTYGGALTLNNAGNSFTGNGNGLVNVNALTLGGLGPNNFWQTTGNAGTTAGVNFMGTTDNQPLELDAYGVRGLHLERTGRSSGFPFLFTQSGVNVIGGYWGNIISNTVIGGVIAGGGDETGPFIFTPYPNTVVNDFGAIGGGYGNIAGTASVIPGGYFNLATGNGSFAAGRKAQTTFDGSFIWSDGTKTNNSSGANCFDINASGGVYINGSDLYFYPNNNNYGLGYRSSFAGITIDGPVLYSYLGGALAAVSPDTIALKWDYSGDIWVSNNLSTATLTIRGGADLAEPFNISVNNKGVPLGAVVVIDDQNPGQLKISDLPYDTHVAGIISGANGVNPGIQMHQQGLLEGGKNVALTGRVYVQADASNGAIRPGDLLTTSSTPGCAMRVSDHARAAGAILGKAMTGLNQGQGMVLVLVTLQ
jgi:hypothetical protein